MCAIWKRQEEAEEFEIKILLPSEMCLHLGHGVTTNPISIELEIYRGIAFAISGGINVPVASQLDPLDFEMSLRLIAGAKSLPDVEFNAVMPNYWNDPFGISKDLSLGDVSFDMGIHLEDLGFPSVSFGAGLKLLDSTMSFQVDIDEDPKREPIFF
jgi:hypothetical protein